MLCWPRSYNNAPIYMSVNPKAQDNYRPFSLYLYKDSKTGELTWMVGSTSTPHGSHSWSEFGGLCCGFASGRQTLFVDSSPSAKGGCGANGPAAPACKWRECKGVYCLRLQSPQHFYGASASLKVFKVGGGGH